MKTIKMLLLDVENQKVSIVNIKPELDEYYKLLNCEYVEMPTRVIGGKYFTIICDEEGLLKSDVVMSAIDSTGSHRLVGNLLICNEVNYAEASLTDDDINMIMEHINVLPTRSNPYGSLLLEVEYE